MPVRRGVPSSGMDCPLGGPGARTVDGGRTQVTPSLSASLLTIQMVDDFADDVLAADTEWSALYTQTANNRRRRTPDAPKRVQELLDRYRAEQHEDYRRASRSTAIRSDNSPCGTRL